LIEIRSPCNSSSQTFSTVPAFPSVRTTALPIKADCASPYSFKIFDAWRFTGIARPCSAASSDATDEIAAELAQQRDLIFDGMCNAVCWGWRIYQAFLGLSSTL